MIISGLELTPGKLVAESGTGSTSLSHAIIRSVAPTGHLNTFEFNDYRFEYAKKDFTNNLGSFKDNVSVFHRDVLKEGFKSDNIVEYDAIFLDLVKLLKGKGSRPFTDIPGHTGFLTFATKV